MISQRCPAFAYFSAVFLFLLSAVAGEAAHAQEAETPQKIPRRFAFKLGIYHPMDKDVQVSVDNLPYVGFSYDIGKIKIAGIRQTKTKPLLYQAYFDFGFKKPGRTNAPTSRSFSESDVTGRLVGIGPALKWVLAPLTARNQPYLGMGAGYYKATVPDFGIIQYFNPSGAINGPLLAIRGINGNATAERIGGKVFVGTQGRGGILGELDYTFLSKISGIKPGGWGAHVGYRF